MKNIVKDEFEYFLSIYYLYREITRYCIAMSIKFLREF